MKKLKMYARQQITSGNKKFIYANKGDMVTVLDTDRSPTYLCERNDERFRANMADLQDEPLELSEVKPPDVLAAKTLKAELRKLLNRDAYQFQIMVNRVYYDKVSKFPKHIDKAIWLILATEVWESSDMALRTLIDLNKANV